MPSECLTRTAVELPHDIVQVRLPELRQIGFHGKELTKQAVGILVAAGLPARVGSANQLFWLKHGPVRRDGLSRCYGRRSDSRL